MVSVAHCAQRWLASKRQSDLFYYSLGAVSSIQQLGQNALLSCVCSTDLVILTMRRIGATPHQLRFPV